MYLRIPNKEDFVKLAADKLFKLLNKRHVNLGLLSFNDLNNFSISNEFMWLLSDNASLDTTRKTYSTFYIPKDTIEENNVKSTFHEHVNFVADGNELLEKGKVVEELDDGSKIVQYGKQYKRISNVEDLNRVIVSDILSGMLKKIEERHPVAVDKDGNIQYADVYYSETLQKNIVIIKARNNRIESASPGEVTIDSLKNKDIVIGEQINMEWLVIGNIAISLGNPFSSQGFEDYNTSHLKNIINSEEFQRSFQIEPTKMFKRNNPFKVSIPTLREQLDKSLEIGIIPFLVGPPGVGKTEVVKSLSSHVVSYNMSTYTPSSFTGKDYVLPGDVIVSTDDNGNQITHTEKALTGSSEPIWLQGVKKALDESKKDGENVILFLDEFDKLSPALQVFVNGIIDNERTIGGWKVPDEVKIVLAGNTTIDSLASNKISSEVSSRLMTIDVQPNIDEWLKWACNSDVDPIVVSYLKTNPQDLLYIYYDSTNKQDASYSMNPRKWTKMVSKELKLSRLNGTNLMLNNYMPKDLIEKFMKFVDFYFEYQIEDIIMGTAPIFIGSEIESNMFVLTCLCVATNVSNIKNVLKYINNNEYKSYFVNAWLNYHPNNKVELFQILSEIDVEGRKTNGK